MNQRNASGRHLSDCDTPSVHRRLSSTEAREYSSLVTRHAGNSRTRETFSENKQTLTYLHCREHQRKGWTCTSRLLVTCLYQARKGWQETPRTRGACGFLHSNHILNSPTTQSTLAVWQRQRRQQIKPSSPRSLHCHYHHISLSLSLWLEYVKLKKICRLARDGQLTWVIDCGILVEFY